MSDRLPPVLRGGVVDLAVRGALALAVVALAAALLTDWYAWRSRPSPVAVPAAQVQSASTTTHRGPPSGPSSPGWPSPSGWSSPSTGVVVDVAGRVRRPGVFHLPAGARTVDALARAGGVLPGTDTTGLPLARKLVDGEQILVDGRPGTATASATVGQAGPAVGPAHRGSGPARRGPST